MEGLLTVATLEPILDASPTGFAVVAPSEEIVLSNRTLAQFAGRTASEMVGRKWHEFVTPDSLPAARHRFHDVDGGMVLALTAPLEILVSDGRITSLMSSARSITLAEGRFVIVEMTVPELYQEQLAPAHTGRYLAILITDHDWRVTHTTPFAREILGGQDDLTGSGLLGLVHPLEAVSLVTALAELGDEGVAASVPLSLHTGHGWKPVLLHVATLCSHTPPRLVCVLSDRQEGTDERRLVTEPQAAATVVSESAIRHLAAQLGRAGRPEAADAEFSDAQWEMIARSLRGQTPAEIAKEMFLNRGTVRNALSDIYRRLGVRNQLELVAALTGGHRASTESTSRQEDRPRPGS